jgi:hypothetical protein
MALEPQLFERYFLDGERVAPRHALVLPGGHVAFDLSLCFDLKDVDQALAEAVANFEPLSFAAAPTCGNVSWFGKNGFNGAHPASPGVTMTR